jgi:hypothetical protein
MEMRRLASQSQQAAQRLKASAKKLPIQPPPQEVS